MRAKPDLPGQKRRKDKTGESCHQGNPKINLIRASDFFEATDKLSYRIPSSSSEVYWLEIMKVLSGLDSLGDPKIRSSLLTYKTVRSHDWVKEYRKKIKLILGVGIKVFSSKQVSLHWTKLFSFIYSRYSSEPKFAFFHPYRATQLFRCVFVSLSIYMDWILINNRSKFIWDWVLMRMITIGHYNKAFDCNCCIERLFPIYLTNRFNLIRNESLIYARNFNSEAKIRDTQIRLASTS